MVATDERALSDVRPWTAYAGAALRQPIPLLSLYLLTLLPSLAIAALVALPMLEWSRHPLFRQALLERSISDLGAFMAQNFDYPPLAQYGNLAGWLLLLIAWPLVRLLWLFFEGGALSVYADPCGFSWRTFWRGCRRWFWTFLGINLFGLLWMVVIVVLAAMIGLLLTRWVQLIYAVLIGALLLLFLWSAWIEVARASAVACDDRHVGRALLQGGQLLLRRTGALAILFFGSLALYGALFLLHTWAIRALPIPWWLFSFAVQQIYLIARMGVRLARQAGEVGLAAAAFPAPGEAPTA